MSADDVQTFSSVTTCLSAGDALNYEMCFERAMLENMFDAVVAFDFEGKLRLANRAAHGWHVNFASGMPIDEWNRCFDLYDSEAGVCVPDHDRPLATALRGERVQGARLGIEIAGYARRYIVASAAPIYGPDGAGLGAVFVWRDVSEHRKWVDRIRTARARLREAQRVGRVGSWEFDIATRQFWGSAETGRIFGSRSSEHAVDLDAFVSRVREKEMVTRSIRNAIEVGELSDIEFTLLPEKAGDPKVLSSQGEVVRGPDGKVVRMVGVVRDITVERRALEAVKDIGERLALALNAAGASPFEWDLRTDAILWSEQRRSPLGIAVGTFDGRFESFMKSVHGDDVSDLEAAFAAARDGHNECTHEFRVVWPDGSVHWLEIRGRFRYALNRAPISMAGVIVDVTERRTTEENTERLAAIVECSNDAIVSVDIDGNILTGNPAAQRMLGFSLEEIRGKPVAELIPPTSREALRLDLTRLWRGEPVGPIEKRAVTKNSGEIDVSFTAAPVRVRGRTIAAAAVARDVTEAKRAQLRLDRQLAHLKALRSIDAAILGSVEIRLALAGAVGHVLDFPDVDAATILLLDRNVKALNYAAGCGFKTADVSRIQLRYGEGLAGTAAMACRPVVARPTSFAADAAARYNMITEEGFAGYAALPLLAKREVKGVLEVFGRRPFSPESDTLEFLESVAGHVAMAIDYAALLESLQRSNTNLVRAYDATIEGWSRALDLRDAGTRGHSQRVTDLSLSLARALAVPGEQLEQIRRGALLHDIGKMALPDSILRKPGPLTDMEQAIMRRHPEHAADMLSPIEFLRPALDIPSHHHERWDGNGYPHGLAGQRIPLAARIFAVVDVWDALCSDRPYRRAWPRDKALEHIRAATGTHFDPAVVKAFLEIVQERCADHSR